MKRSRGSAGEESNRSCARARRTSVRFHRQVESHGRNGAEEPWERNRTSLRPLALRGYSPRPPPGGIPTDTLAAASSWRRRGRSIACTLICTHSPSDRRSWSRTSRPLIPNQASHPATLRRAIGAPNLAEFTAKRGAAARKREGRSSRLAPPLLGDRRSPSISKIVTISRAAATERSREAAR